MINSEQAIAISVENDGVTIVLTVFDDSDEALLRNAATTYAYTDDSELRCRYTGEGWVVELFGCGDPAHCDPYAAVPV
jgi:hypothetical protein